MFLIITSMFCVFFRFAFWNDCYIYKTCTDNNGKSRLRFCVGGFFVLGSLPVCRYVVSA